MSEIALALIVTEKTELVTSGVFGIVRNPIFAAMMLTSAGLAIITPNLVALTAFAALLSGIQLEGRAVEEPYLFRTHGAAYAAYVSRVGRFVPLVGRTRRLDAAAQPTTAGRSAEDRNRN